MDKVRDNFDTYRNDVDDILYYNPDELNRMLDEEEIEEARKLAREEGLKEGREEGRLDAIKETAKKMKEFNIELKKISEITNLNIDEIIEL